ncbi:MAG: hypothetical protein P8H31_01975 [Porticoccaceae bacterium]|nr:hypothetical protein [Porticoccaceae bacterium]
MGLAVFILFVICGIYVQRRGEVQHENLSRKLTDHSNLFGSLGCLFYSFPKAPNSPYVGAPRYHPDLVNPDFDNCYINIDGQRYLWPDGDKIGFKKKSFSINL